MIGRARSCHLSLPRLRLTSSWRSSELITRRPAIPARRSGRPATAPLDAAGNCDSHAAYQRPAPPFAPLKRSSPSSGVGHSLWTTGRRLHQRGVPARCGDGSEPVGPAWHVRELAVGRSGLEPVAISAEVHGAQLLAGLADEVAFADQDLVGLCRRGSYADSRLDGSFAPHDRDLSLGITRALLGKRAARRSGGSVRA